MIRNRIIVDPVNIAGERPLIEPNIQQLYDSEVWSSTTTEVAFFRRGQGSKTIGGDATAGANIKKTLRHTNLSVAGILPKPEMYLILGCRLHVPEAPQTTSSDARNGTTSWGHPEAALQQYLSYLCYYKLRIGSKNYITGPGFFFPSNRGINTQLASMRVGQRVENINSTSHVAQAFACHTIGNGYGLGPGLLITEGEEFRAELKAHARQSLNAIDATAFPSGANDGLHRLVYNFLEGVAGRAVQ